MYPSVNAAVEMRQISALANRAKSSSSKNFSRIWLSTSDLNEFGWWRRDYILVLDGDLDRSDVCAAFSCSV